MKSFAKRVVLITGAGSGIGAALARRMATEGALIAALDRSSDPLAALARECPGSAWAVADVTNRLSLNQAVAELSGKLGSVDMLIACAGIGIQTSAPTWNAADFESVIQVNLIGVANSIAAVMPGMIQRHGLVYSAWHRSGVSSWLEYCAQRGDALMDSCLATPGQVSGDDLSGLPSHADDDATRTGRRLSLDNAVEKMVRAIRSRRSWPSLPGGLAATRHESVCLRLRLRSIVAVGRPGLPVPKMRQVVEVRGRGRSLMNERTAQGGVRMDLAASSKDLWDLIDAADLHFISNGFRAWYCGLVASVQFRGSITKNQAPLNP